jgi:hypothetical protein
LQIVGIIIDIDQCCSDFVNEAVSGHNNIHAMYSGERLLGRLEIVVVGCGLEVADFAVRDGVTLD